MVDAGAFVCLGNIYTFSNGEAIMRQRLKDRNIQDIRYIQEVLVAGI